MAVISFWGGIGVIGSSKILIEQEHWRVLLDCGLDFHPGRGLFREGITPRPDRELADLLRTGSAPRIPNLFASRYVAGTGLAGGSDGQTAVCVTHAHLDHIGLTGFVDPAITLYASPETAALMRALHAAHQDVGGRVPEFTEVEEGQPFDFGPFHITRYDVDHDVVGASGYLVETEDGTVAFTGDIRFHGRHPGRSVNFAHKAAGSRLLVCEGTMLSADFHNTVRQEEEVDRQFSALLDSAPSLVLMTLYPRNIERVEAFMRAARAHGREILWPQDTARFLQEMGLSGIREWGGGDLDAVSAQPAHYILQVTPQELPALLDLPLGPGAVFIHANGEPLGPFDPRYEALKDWLDFLHVPFRSIGTSGHATAEALENFVRMVRPDILVPLHSMNPERLLAPAGVDRWLPQGPGHRYPLAPGAENLGR